MPMHPKLLAAAFLRWRRARSLDKPVFDRGREVTALFYDPDFNGLATGIHRTEKDRRVPRNTVTAVICGDPSPERSALGRAHHDDE